MEAIFLREVLDVFNFRRTATFRDGCQQRKGEVDAQCISGIIFIGDFVIYEMAASVPFVSAIATFRDSIIARIYQPRSLFFSLIN